MHIVTKDDLKKLFWYDNWKPNTFWKHGCAIKSFFDSTTEEWFNHTLENKLGGVFTSTSSMHGGQETTLIKYDVSIDSSWNDNSWSSIQ